MGNINDNGHKLAYGFNSYNETTKQNEIIYYADQAAREAIKAGINLVSLSALPTADAEAYASYAGKIVLIPASKEGVEKNVKAEYVILRAGEEGAYTYIWEKIGDTDIDLSGYSKVGHTHTVTAAGTNAESEVSFDKADDKVLGADTTFKAAESDVTGSASVSGSNASSAVSFTGGTDDKVLGADTTFKAAESDVTAEAAAQAWSQKSGSASAAAANGAVTTSVDANGIVTFGMTQPTITVSDVVVTGENAKSNVSGKAAAQAISIDSKDEVTAVTGIGTATAAAQVWSQSAGTISGKAAAQAISIDSADEVTALTGISNAKAAAQVFTGSSVSTSVDVAPQA